MPCRLKLRKLLQWRRKKKRTSLREWSDAVVTHALAAAHQMQSRSSVPARVYVAERLVCINHILKPFAQQMYTDTVKLM